MSELSEHDYGPYPTCTASLVVYENSSAMLAELLQSLPGFLPVVVVDNSPTVELEQFFAGFSQVTYRFSGCNLGYGKGHNLGIALSPPSDFHLIMNPDVVVRPGALEQMLRCMDNDSRIGVLCPQVCNPDGSLQFLNRRYPTVLDLFLRRFVPHGAFTERRAWHEMRDIGYDAACDVESVSGAFMLCRRTLLEKLGGFDPRYFMYFEDVDLSRECHRAGYRTVYCPDAVVVHQWARASYRNLRLTVVHIINMIRYFNKWGWKWW